MRARLRALVEVCLVFVLAHVAFRSFRQFTPWGRAEVAAGINLSPGMILIASALLAGALRRGRASDFGFRRSDIARQLAVGFWFLIAFAAGGAVLVLAGLRTSARELRPLDAAVVAVVGIAGTGALLWLLRRHPRLERVPAALSLSLFGAILAVPCLGAWLGGGSVGEVGITLAWLVLGVGLGEELFFRGYVQSRIDAAFGRPWRFFGTRYGAGLLVAALLFGLVHALNPTDYFHGKFAFAWWHGLVTAAMPFGFLREKAGGIVAPVFVHVLLDVLLRTPGMLAAP